MVDVGKNSESRAIDRADSTDEARVIKTGRRGQAAKASDCKSDIPGSNPGVASFSLSLAGWGSGKEKLARNLNPHIIEATLKVVDELVEPPFDNLRSGRERQFRSQAP